MMIKKVFTSSFPPNFIEVHVTGVIIERLKGVTLTSVNSAPRLLALRLAAF